MQVIDGLFFIIKHMDFSTKMRYNCRKDPTSRLGELIWHFLNTAKQK